MNLNPMKMRAVSILLAVALAVVTLAPVAQADRGHVRYRGSEHRTVVIERHSSAVGPALFGFIGGLVLGSVITSASQQYARPVAADYEYYDPYCDRYFASFRDYDRHLDRYDHPRRLMVMARDGRCVVRYEDEGSRWMRVDGRYGRDDRYDRDGAWPQGDDRWYGGYRRGDGSYRDDDRYRRDDRSGRDEGYRPNDGRADDGGEDDGGN